MPELTDACGRVVAVPERPQRVVCLCPSLTETLFELGLDERLVGRTRYCIHPAPQIDAVAVVGGTKKIDFDGMTACAPDLIIAEKEENRREDVEALAQRWPVYVCDIQNLEQASDAIGVLGRLTGQDMTADQLVQRIEQAWQGIAKLRQPLRVLYLIWRKPWMAAGQDTYINAVLQRAGMSNVALALPGRYPQIDSAELAALKPDVCLLSSEPYPFEHKHAEELARLMPGTHMQLVDGEMFSWYGARMLMAARYLGELVTALDEARQDPSISRR